VSGTDADRTSKADLLELPRDLLPLQTSLQLLLLVLQLQLHELLQLPPLLHLLSSGLLLLCLHAAGREAALEKRASYTPGQDWAFG
jgi:hypothetical protein